MKSGVRRIKGFKRHPGGEGAGQVQGIWEMPPMDDTVISLGWGGGAGSRRFGTEAARTSIERQETKKEALKTMASGNGGAWLCA